jgi:hypothetical protein
VSDFVNVDAYFVAKCAEGKIPARNVGGMVQFARDQAVSQVILGIYV